MQRIPLSGVFHEIYGTDNGTVSTVVEKETNTVQLNRFRLGIVKFCEKESVM